MSPPRGSAGSNLALWILALLATVAACWAWFSRWPSPPAAPAAARPAASPPSPQRLWQPRSRVAVPAPGCTARAELRCLDGDPWTFDSCGNPYEPADECGLSRCVDGACEGGVSGCEEPGLGRCDGDVARGCAAGKGFAVDCNATDQRCAMTEEGPVCRDRTTDDCSTPPGQTRCDGEVLVACVEGRLARLDCRTVAGHCVQRRSQPARCVRIPLPSAQGCDACGCPPDTDATEVCDGLDNDGDDLVDENVDCGAIDLVAIVVTDAAGNSSYTDDDIAAEVDRINFAFARDDDLGLRFHLAETVRRAEPTWLRIDDALVQELLSTGAFNPKRDAFYIPLVFTDELFVDEVPRPGLATPPNGMCGGQRRTRFPQPALGAVVIAKRRYPSTVAHEIGHFLGLCHTHMATADIVETRGEADACVPPCALEGDGVCDTPTDPGPDVCEADHACAIHCGDGERPEPTNLMGYYPDCRDRFSAEQARLMRTSLALRRGWHRCIWDDGCVCDPLSDACPEGMSCRRYEAPAGDAWRCGLDGGSAPGGTCTSPEDCSLGSICIAHPAGDSRCTRPCALLSSFCECRVLEGFAFPICVDDLAGP